MMKGFRTQSTRQKVSSHPVHRVQGRGISRWGIGLKAQCHPTPSVVDGEVTGSIASVVPMVVRKRMQLSFYGAGGQ